MNTHDDSEPANRSAEQYQTAEEIARVFGVTAQTVNKWRVCNVIFAEIEEGTVVRYDLEKVRKRLKERAVAKSEARVEREASRID